MRISQLAAETGVAVATIKFYLRERLLPEGQRTSPTQAQYDASHVARLRLIRALLGPGGLSVAATRELLHNVDHPPESQHRLLGVAHQAVQLPVPARVDLTSAVQLMQRWGWHVDPSESPALASLADALQGLADAGFDIPEERLDGYRAAMKEVAESEIADVPTESTEAAVRYVVLGTILVEPLLLALRRLAQQDASHRRFGSATVGQTEQHD